MTELAPETARSYCKAIKVWAAMFLSINHEHDPLTVRDLFSDIGLAAIRSPYWMRRGYVEELFRINH
jgi:hypothetical protein